MRTSRRVGQLSSALGLAAVSCFAARAALCADGSPAAAMRTPGEDRAGALTFLPPADVIAETISRWMVDNAKAIVGTRVSFAVGKEPARPMRLVSVDPAGIEVERSGMTLRASWKRLGPSGIHRAAASLLERAPAGVHEAWLLLALKLGARPDEVRDQLISLHEKDPALAAGVGELVDMISAEGVARVCRGALSTRSAPTRATSTSEPEAQSCSYAAYIPADVGPPGARDLGSPGNVFHVSPGGTDTPGRGSPRAPLRTLAFACSLARARDVIRLVSGEYRESEESIVRSGVRIAGEGRSGSSASIIHAPPSWDFTADEFDCNPNGFVVRLEGVEDVTIEGICFRGNGHKANGAVLCANSKRVTIREIDVYDFRLSGMRFNGSSGIDVAHVYVENSAYERGPKAGDALPDGGSLGNIDVHGVTDSLFGHITVKTTGLHGYGLKLGSLTRCRFHDMDFHMHPFQSWRGVSGGNFDVEVHGGHAELVEFDHNTFRETVSLMGGNEARYRRVPYSIHLHHNLFDLEGTYGIEVGTDKMVVDHNWFRGTWACLQNYGGSESRISGLTVLNNVATGITMRFVGFKGRVENLRVVGNTVGLVRGGGQSYLVTLGSNDHSRHWLIANNIVSGSGDGGRALVAVYDAKTAPRDVRVVRNLVYDLDLAVDVGGAVDPAKWGHTYEGNVTANPRLNAKPSSLAELVPAPGSPAVDRGFPTFGMENTFCGRGRDVGALECGRRPWTCGPGTTSSAVYLWGPVTSLKRPWFVKSTKIDLMSPVRGLDIRYTTDGSEPGPASPLYDGPIKIDEPTLLRARTFQGSWGSASTLSYDMLQGVKGYANLAAGGKGTASSTYNPPVLYGAAQAFDDVTYSWTGWAADSGDKRPWLRVDFGAPCRIRFIELHPRGVFDSPESRRNFEIQASNDSYFKTYAVLARQTDTAFRHQGVFEAEVTDAHLYRYVRAIKTADEWFFVAELRILGERR